MKLMSAVRYLRKVEKVDPFTWWAGNRGAYTQLSLLARKWLGAVATSVPPECAFSSSGNIITAKRSTLTPELVQDLVFIAENTRRKTRVGIPARE